ncbi:MAG: GntR family transcriptional regulator [Lachnospiraceae bacterium]|nr:GntR family transcriptional regulator [Ruminococcus sp.]MCM1274567.1 GntR family transcriptional regulator [Lachnospiraceae bacterium]
MFTMRLEGGAPIYEQLEQRITELILRGEMAEGEKLPAVREIAKQLSINPNTVQKTYANLETQGLIYSIPAKGSYVAERGKYLDAVKRKSGEAFAEAVSRALKQGLAKADLIRIVEEVDAQ